MPNYRVRIGEIQHSWGPWKKHIYIGKHGDKYIYPDDYRENLKSGKATEKTTVSKNVSPSGYSKPSVKEAASKLLATKDYSPKAGPKDPNASKSSGSGETKKGKGSKAKKSDEQKAADKAAKEAAKAEKAALKEQKAAERQAKKDAKDAKEKKAQDLIDKFREDVEKSGMSAKNLFRTNSFSELLEKYGIEADSDEAKRLKSKLMKEFDIKSSYAVAKQEPQKKVKTRARPRKVSAITEPKVKAKVRTRTGLAHSDEHYYSCVSTNEGDIKMPKYWKAYSGDELEHSSKYTGGFAVKNGRMNNTSAYNHDYYMKNKEKWAEKHRSHRYKGGRNVSDPTKKGTVKGRDPLGENDGYDYERMYKKLINDWDDAKMDWVRSRPEHQEAFNRCLEAENNYIRYTDENGDAQGFFPPENWNNFKKAGNDLYTTTERLGKEFDNLGEKYREENYMRSLRSKYQNRDKYSYLI